MNKRNSKKDFEYEKKLEEFDVEKFKDLLVRDSAQVEYVRINITLPKQIAQLSKNLYNEPRSKTITSMYLDDIEEKKKRNKMKSWEKDLKKYGKKMDKEALEILEDFDYTFLDKC